MSKLPPLFQEIIETQRAIDRLMSRPAVPFTEANEAIKRKKELVRAAKRLYSPGARGGPKTNA